MKILKFSTERDKKMSVSSAVVSAVAAAVVVEVASFFKSTARLAQCTSQSVVIFRVITQSNLNIHP